jgi:hypothetical protein
MTYYEIWQIEKGYEPEPESDNQNPFENGNLESSECSEWFEKQVENEMADHD